MLKKIAIFFGVVTLFIGFNSYYEANKEPNYQAQISKRKVGNTTIITLPDNLEIYIGGKIDEESVLPKEIKDFSKIAQSGEYEKYVERDRYKAVTEKFAALKYNEFNFYGQFLDQNKKPISGIQMELALAQPIPGGGWYDIPMYTSTDKNGMFHISNVKGEFFNITSARKLGYTFRTKNIKQTFGKSRNNVNTSITNPKFFTGWKYGDHLMPKLEGFTAILKKSPNTKDQSYTFNLDSISSRKDIVEGQDGDVVISVKRVWEDYSKGRGKEYEITLKFNEGGAIQITDDYPYRAPVSGYLPSITISNNKSSENWNRGRFDEGFYVKTKDNKFARIFFEIYPFYSNPGMRLQARVIINTVGERLFITEYDIKRNDYKHELRFK